MTIGNVNVEDKVISVTTLITNEENFSPTLRNTLEILLLLISILVNSLGLNGRNIRKPTVSDQLRKKERTTAVGRKPGGQHDHVGKTLQQVKEPHIVKPILVDRSLLGPGEYRSVVDEVRLVIDLDIGIVVTEWQAEILVD